MRCSSLPVVEITRCLDVPGIFSGWTNVRWGVIQAPLVGLSCSCHSFNGLRMRRRDLGYHWVSRYGLRFGLFVLLVPGTAGMRFHCGKAVIYWAAASIRARSAATSARMRATSASATASAAAMRASSSACAFAATRRAASSCTRISKR